MKLAILDKDGTIVQPKSGNKFVQNPTDQILIDGVVDGCKRLIDAGYVLAIASNQGGVSAGFKTLDQASSEMSYRKSPENPALLGRGCRGGEMPIPPATRQEALASGRWRVDEVANKFLAQSLETNDLM